MLAIAGATLLLVTLAPQSAVARDGYGAYPGVKVSRDLEDAWILQLSPGSGVVPGYHAPDLDNPIAAGYNPSGVTLEGRRDDRQLPRRAQPGRRDVQDLETTGSIAAYGSRQASVRPSRAAPAPRQAVDPTYLPQTVDYDTKEAAGTIVIDTENKYLYHVEPNGKAKRYGVGVGKPGFEWAGTHTVSQKREWPTWTPPSEMRDREKAKGKILPASMEGGPGNPLGARAMYLGSTLYRIHGTNQPWSIGKAVSSGCIRMRNEDVIDLYEHVNVGTHVVVM